jgi:hypothetical protein
MLGVEIIDVDGVHPVTCEECEATTAIVSLMKSRESFAGLQRGKEVGENLWRPSPAGWRCPTCHEAHERETRLSEQPMVTVPEPPDEWRFCQGCGEQINPTRLNGRYCSACSG